MMNRTELNLEAAEMVNGGKKVTAKEFKKACKNDKFALHMAEMAESAEKLFKALGFKNVCTYEINK